MVWFITIQVLLLLAILLLNHYIVAKAKLEGASSQNKLDTTGHPPHVDCQESYAVTRREVSMAMEEEYSSHKGDNIGGWVHISEPTPPMFP